MKVGGAPNRTIWPDPDGRSVRIIDQTQLPFAFETVRLRDVEGMARAIRDMLVRGAPLIGAAGAYGLWLAAQADPGDDALDRAHGLLAATRPTAINLRWALDRVREALRNQPALQRADLARRLAAEICEEDVAINKGIGGHGLRLIEQAAAGKPQGQPVNILTHCNAGWLATVDWGTA
ncbi:MAG: S-methyl-5-thioribose-1-phosphate isomerase, partial [Hypericibacter sp.]